MTESLQTTCVVSPFGLVTVLHKGMTLRRVSIDVVETSAKTTGSQQIIDQFEAYFSDASHVFGFVLETGGTHHQTRVWKALNDIPVGGVLTYGQLAKKLRSGPRAVARACRANPLPIVVPCHRVVSANGPGGYMGTTSGPAMAIKHWLLRHERAS